MAAAVGNRARPPTVPADTVPADTVLPAHHAAGLGVCQAQLYAAEGESIDSLGRRWSRLGDAQAYVDDLVCSSWFFDRWPHLVRCVLERRGAKSRWSTCQHLDAEGPRGLPTEGVILVADRQLAQPVILHELAHLLLPSDVGHDQKFAETLLILVRHEMGFFAFAEFLHALRRTDAFSAVRIEDGTGGG